MFLQDPNIKEYAHICSLGFCCQTYSYLRRSLDMSLTRTPFDDMCSPYLHEFLPLLKQGWREGGFYSLDNIEVTGQHQFCWGVKDKLSLSSSIHNFPVRGFPVNLATYKFGPEHDLFLQAWKQVVDHLPIYLEKKREEFRKFKRMIRKNCETILFLRSNRGQEPKKHTLMLLDYLSRARDDKPFELWVFQDSDLMNEEWGGNPNLRVFRDKKWNWGQHGWHGNEELWDEVFKSVRSKRTKKKGQW